MRPVILARGARHDSRPGTMGVRHISANTSIIAIQGDLNAFSESALLESYARANSSTTRVIILNFAGMST